MLPPPFHQQTLKKTDLFGRGVFRRSDFSVFLTTILGAANLVPKGRIISSSELTLEELLVLLYNELPRFSSLLFGVLCVPPIINCQLRACVPCARDLPSCTF